MEGRTYGDDAMNVNVDVMVLHNGPRLVFGHDKLMYQAHNLEDSAREAASAKLSLRALSNASGEMYRLGMNCE